MAMLEINGRRVEVDDSFRSLSPEQQQATVDEIAASMGAPKDYRGEGGGRGTGLEAALVGARQGVTLGFGDEINAGVRAAGDWVGNPFKVGDGKPFGEAYDERLAHERGLLDQTRRENPVATTAGEIAGAVMLPAGSMATAKTVGGAALRGAVAGGGFGAVAGAGNAEGGPAARAEGAAGGAALGALFGGAASGAIAVGTKAFRGIYGRAMREPTVERLKAAKTAAYRAVDDSGEAFAPTELQGMAAKAREAIESSPTYVPDVDAQTTAALTILDRTSGRPMKIGQLDTIRKNLWKRYTSNPDQVGILDAIDAIDDLVETRAGTSDLMQAARAANRQFKKAELLQVALTRAENQTASTGSGGNVLNKYRQAVTAIVNDPKRSKWFAPEEMAAMQKIIDGSLGENVLRRVGKLAPTGNGLMMFLNLMGGATVGPEFLAVTAAGAGAKAASDASARGRVDRLFGAVSGAAPQQAPYRIPQGVNALAGYSSSR